MKHLIAFVTFLLLAPLTALAQWQIPKDSTTFKIPVHAAQDTDHAPKTNVSSLTCNLVKNGADVACDGTSAEVDDTNAPGGWSYTVGADDTDTAGASLVFYFTASGMDPFRAIAQVGPITANVVQVQGSGAPSLFDGVLDDASGTTLTLAANAVDVDDQFNGSMIELYDANGMMKARSCIIDSTNTGETIITADNIAALLTPDTDTYRIVGGSGCTARVVANADKTGYSLSQAFPSNFSSLAITGGGAVTAGTVSDKTGYSLSSSQTFNVTGNITGNLSGSVGSVSGNVGGNVTGNVGGSVASVTAGVTLADDSITEDKITAGGANKIADHTLRRNNDNVEASSDGDTLDFQSLYGAVAKQTNNISVSGSTLTIKKADGTTDFDTQALTSSAGAAPITGMSTN